VGLKCFDLEPAGGHGLEQLGHFGRLENFVDGDALGRSCAEGSGGVSFGVVGLVRHARVEAVKSTKAARESSFWRNSKRLLVALAMRAT